LKPSGELGHNVYHLAGMSEFLTLDINTQKFSRDVVLREEIDLYEIIFDKAGIIRTMPRCKVGLLITNFLTAENFQNEFLKIFRTNS
jgi:hypothetical protein